MINIKTIWDSHKPKGVNFIRTKIEDIPRLNCYAATNHITGQHLFILSVSKTVKIPELKNYRFRGVEIFSIETENSFELNIYLLDNDLKDIFSLFIQNVLEDICDCVTENEALTKTLSVVAKWKKLFDKINFNGLNSEQQKGLIGELLFINYLLDNGKSAAHILNAWTGADFEDKDFSFCSVGVEVKFTSAKTPKVTISSERQLDAQSLRELYLLLYIAEEVKENGFSLNSLIAQIRSKITNTDELKLFNENLMLIGYFEDDKSHYGKMYSLKKQYTFEIKEDFPKIIKSQIHLSIFDVKYSIELSAIENFIVNIETLLPKI